MIHGQQNIKCRWLFVFESDQIFTFTVDIRHISRGNFFMFREFDYVYKTLRVPLACPCDRTNSFLVWVLEVLRLNRILKILYWTIMNWDSGLIYHYHFCKIFRPQVAPSQTPMQLVLVALSRGKMTRA
jgi:hypothetical protein